MLLVAIAATLASAAGKPPTNPNNPVITFVAPSPGDDATVTDGDVTYAFTFNRTPKQVASVTCALSGEASVSGACEAPVPEPVGSKTTSKSGESYTDLADGTYTFTVTLTLTGGGVYTATRGFTVAANGTPVASQSEASGVEDTPLSLTLTASDPDGDSLAYSVASPPANGTLSGLAPDLTYTPAPDYFGTDSFTFTASDGTATSAAATVSITVAPVNDPPVAGADSASTDENTPVAFNVATLLANDVAGPANEAGQVLTVTAAISGPFTHGTVTFLTNTVTYTPDADFVGEARFAYAICDDGATQGQPDPQCDTQAVTITVG